jgi:hypothetical protein
MSEIFNRILALVARREILISDHGYDELAADGILIRDVYEGVRDAIVVEEYPTNRKGPCVLVFERDRDGQPIHVLWGIPANATSPAVVVTAYRPDPRRWAEDFVRRKP